MSKWIIVLMIAAVGLFACSSPSNKTASSADFLKYVPEDTVAMFQSQNNAELMALMEDYPLLGLIPSQQAMLDTFLSQEGKEKDNQAAIGFLTALSKSVFQGKQYTYGNLYKGLDLKGNGAAIVYFHGLMPVIRIDLNDSTAVEAALKSAINESGWAPVEKEIGGVQVKTWDLPKKAGEKSLSIALTTHDNILTVTLLNELDSQTVQKERLGLSKVAKSLAQSDKLKTIREQYKFLENYTSFIDLDLIGQTFLNPESTLMGKNILALLSEEKKQKFLNSVPANCKTDYSTLFAAVPRFVMGYTKLETNKQQATMSAVAALEINNLDVTNALTSLNGHIPSHVTQLDSSLFSVGVGFNAQTLASTLTKLHSQFTQAAFTCPHLVEAQQKAKQQSPAMLNMVTGMIQSVKGAGVSLFDIKLNQATMQPESLSALVSIATNDPQTIASYASLIPVPSLASLQLPADGTPVDVALPGAPASIKVKAAIKGNFIVLYTGKEGETAANAIATEALTNNGLQGLSFDYRKIGGLFEQFTSLPGKNCTNILEMKSLMSQYKMGMALTMSATENGIPFLMDLTMDKYTKPELSLSSKYNMASLNENCAPENIGSMVFNSDGTGNETQTSTDNKCNLSETAFKWNHNGNNSITFESTQNKERFNCDQPFNEGENTTETCYIMNETAQSFQCMFDAGTSDAYVLQLKK